MPFFRKYNTLLVTGTTAIRIPVIKRGVVDFAVGADWTPAAGDVKVFVDAAGVANITNLPTAIASGNTAQWEFILTAAELSCKQLLVMISDSATKAVEDQCFIVETYGNTSAMYAADLSLANLPANVTQLLGTAWLTPSVAGTPDVNSKQLGGTAQTGRDVGASVLVGDKTGFSLTQSFPTNFSALSISATTGLVDITQTAADKVWSTAVRVLTAGTNIALAKGTGVTGFNDIAATDVWAAATRTITGNGDKTGYSLTQTFPTNFADLAITVTTGKVTVGTNSDKTGYTASTVSDKTGYSLSGTQTFNLTGDITGNLSGSVGSLTTNNDKTGYSIGTGGITTTSFAAGAIDAAALAADATTEITAGIRIKKNTALANFMFLMVDSTDHLTPKTGLTITATRSIDGAVFAACANSAVEVASGMYKITLADTDLNGDIVTLRFTATGADDRLLTIITTV